MTGKELLDRIGDADPKLVEAADAKSVGNRRKKWVAMAACFCVAAAGIGITASLLGNTGVSIPAVDISDFEKNPAMCMARMAFHEGKVYVEQDAYHNYRHDSEAGELGWVIDEESQAAFDAMASLREEHLGTAKETVTDVGIGEVAGGLETELGGTLPGYEIYTLKGYPSSFRLCAYRAIEEESGVTSEELLILENLHGITLKTGKDLLEDRLRIPGNWKKAEIQSAMAGEENPPVREIPAELTEAFLKEMCRSPFIDIKKKGRASNVDFHDEHETLAYIGFTMEDGTRAAFYLMDGGYVAYYGLSQYPIQVSGQVFFDILQACQ